MNSQAREMPSAPEVASPAPMQTDVLAGIAFQRARALSPVLFFAMLAWSLVIDFTEHPTLTMAIVNHATGVVVGVVALLSRRSIAPRWGHALCSVMWCSPVISTLFGAWIRPDPLYFVLIPLEMVGAAVLLDTRWVIGLMLGIQVFWIPLSLRASGHAAALALMTALTAQAFALVMQIVMRRALLLHATTAHELKIQLAERLRLEDQLLHAQRMEAVGTLAAGLAHDMNNVLGSITSFASLLTDEVTSPIGRADLEQITAQSMRGAELTRGLLAFSRHGKYRKQALRIDDVVHELMPMLERTLPRSIAIDQQLNSGTQCIEGDPVQLGQILINLGINAAHAMNGHGKMVISTDVVALEGGAANALGLAPERHVRLQVTDTGIGMDEATRRRVFEPFFTTKPAGQGTGLGLSTVWGIVQSHHGAVSVSSTPGVGSTFTVHLPLTARTAPTRSDRPVKTTKLQRTGLVLIADDEPAVRAGTARIVERMGLSAIQACNGDEALALYLEQGTAIDLVILDMVMPVMGGAECFRRLRQAGQVPVLIATGYAVDAEVQEMVAGGAALIEKPFPSSDLVAQVGKLLKAAKALPSTE
jgi:signal transduction histidine kinase/ActR/RegA family two-component response regulator